MNMNKRGIAASSAPTMWTTGIVGLVLLIGMFMLANSINTNIDRTAADLQSQVDADLDAAVGSIQGIATGLQAVEAPAETSGICNNVNGCGGWWDVNKRDRQAVADRVLEELREDDNKDLFRQMEKEGIDIDDDDDILDSWVEQKGEILTDQDPRFGFDEDQTTTADIMIGVTYLDDDGHEETDYFRVQATLDELENGYEDGDVNIDEFDEVRKRFVLPHR